MMERRDFIRGLVGLAGLAVVPGTAQALATDDVDRFLALAKTGLVADRHFYLRRPIVLTEMRSLLITRCRFECDMDGDTMINLHDVQDVTISHCVMDVRGLRGFAGRLFRFDALARGPFQ